MVVEAILGSHKSGRNDWSTWNDVSVHVKKDIERVGNLGVGSSNRRLEHR